ncbi:MAG: hypothetical protein HY893_03645 [Deltaproteobacteria bacterium]|nr:hypothetical protein [Deltaproteobacteria bacterium]
MSIQASELKLYGSAVMPDDDSATAIGGAINTAIKMEFTDITPSGAVEMLSSASGDTTQTVTIYGRDSAGTIVSEVKTLNGVSVVSFTTTFERILKAVMSGAATGTVTIRKASAGATLITLEPGITQVRRPFYAVNTPESGSVTYYEKVFYKNTNGTLTLSSGVIKEAADPSGKVTFGLPATIDDTGTNGTGNNRQVAPSGITFNSSDKNIANGQNLTAGSAQGIWLALTLASTDAAAKTTYDLRCEGTTT